MADYEHLKKSRWDTENASSQYRREPNPFGADDIGKSSVSGSLVNPNVPVRESGLIQRHRERKAAAQPQDIQRAADHGVSGTATVLPHQQQIQKSFGPDHDVSGTRAHVGAQAEDGCDAMGADAYATGTSVAFKQSPDLHTAAHEAAHVIQQKKGVSLSGGVGVDGDAYEQHADAVADRVVRGESAADLLAAMPSEGGGRAIQKKPLATGFEEEQQADTGMDWSTLPEDNPFQQKPRADELPPLPDVNKKPQLGEHSSSQPGKKQADEKELDWRAYVHPSDPGNALGSLNLNQGSEPEAPNANQSRMDPKIRDMAWYSYQQKTEDASSMREAVAPDYAQFMNGSKNPDLIALGFTVPDGFKGDAAAFADRQNVSGGTSIGSLFDKQGGANLLVDDHEGIAHAKRAREQSGAAKPQHDATVSSDHKLKASLLTFKSAEAGVTEGFHRIAGARANIESVKLSNEVSEDKDALEEAKAHAEDVKNTLEFVFGGVLKSLVAGPKEAVDLMESVGAMASYAVGKVSGSAITRAEDKLKADTVKLQSTAAKKAAEEFEGAKAAMRARVLAMRAARESVLSELGQRKAAYETAGNASAKGSGASQETQSKISALVAAVPAVETMTGLIKGMVEKTAHHTTYDMMAGMGFDMAVHAGRAQATNFVTALSQMDFVHQKFKVLDTEWSNRLRSLQKVREQLGGVRPENEEDLEKSVVGRAEGESKNAEGVDE